MPRNKHPYISMLSLLIVANIFCGLFLNIQEVSSFGEITNLLPSKKPKHQEDFYQISTEGFESSAYSPLFVEDVFEEEEKRSKQPKNGDDNYFTNNTTYQNLKIDLTEENKVSFYLTQSNLHQLPFYMLYHCWKAFMIFL